MEGCTFSRWPCAYRTPILASLRSSDHRALFVISILHLSLIGSQCTSGLLMSFSEHLPQVVHKSIVQTLRKLLPRIEEVYWVLTFSAVDHTEGRCSSRLVYSRIVHESEIGHKPIPDSWVIGAALRQHVGNYPVVSLCLSISGGRNADVLVLSTPSTMHTSFRS